MRTRGDIKKAVKDVLDAAAVEERPSQHGGPNGTMRVSEIRDAIKVQEGWEPLPAAVQQVLKRGSTSDNPVFEKVDKGGLTIADAGRHGFWRVIQPTSTSAA